MNQIPLNPPFSKGEKPLDPPPPLKKGAGGIYLFQKIRHTFELVKFSHSIFALPFALTSYLFAHRLLAVPFSLREWLLIIAAMVTARNTAMAFNRLIDRKIDAQNPRTQSRHLPQGLLSTRYVWGFIIFNAAAFIGIAAQFNLLTLMLSPIALGIISAYSFAKRWTALAHFMLGLSLAIAPVGAWIAVTGSFHLFPILLALGVLCWVGGFDILYALEDEAFDRKHGLISIPARIGTRNALVVSRLSHCLAIGWWLMPWALYDLSIFYLSAVLIMGLFLAWEQSLIKASDLSRLNHAFFTLNGVASLVFLLGALGELWLRPLLQP